MTPRAAAWALFAALAVFCGIAVHLIAEFVALGWHSDAALIFSPRHIPLGLLALGATGALALVGAGIARSGNRDGLISAIVGALPDRGCGPRFLGLAFAAQVAVFAVTQAGEGLPIQSGDLGLGFIAAWLAGAVGALLVCRFQFPLIAALGELFGVFCAAAATPVESQSWKRSGARLRPRQCRSIVFAGSRRPPPSAPVIDPFNPARRSQETKGVQFFFGALPCAVGHCPC